MGRGDEPSQSTLTAASVYRTDSGANRPGEAQCDDAFALWITRGDHI